MRIPTNRYLIKVESRTNDTFTGPNGMEFYRAMNLGNVEWYKNTQGTVVLAPENFSPSGPTRCTYKTDEGRKVVMYDRFYNDIQVGDQVFFNYLALKDNVQLDAGKLEFLMMADNINAYVRDGVMHANTGRCIVSPITEKEWEDLTENKEESSIVLPDHIKDRTLNDVAKVIAVGKNWKGWKENDIKIGDVVIHSGSRIDYLDEKKTMGMLYYTDISCILR